MKHTPGPWQFTDNMYGINNLRVFGVEDKTGPFNVANCGFGVWSEANAHLIAAAPEMLEALKESLVLLDVSYLDWAWAKTPNANADYIFEVKERVKEVIAKATGEVN
jgi:hypothetical protein